MTKDKFIELVQTAGGYKTKKEASAAIDAFTAAVTEALVAKDSVSLVGFGSFDTALQKGKSGKVPMTGKTYTSADKIIPKFKFGKTVKDRVEAGK